MFKLYNFGKSDLQDSGIEDMLQNSADFSNSETALNLLYSLKELIMLNSNKDRVLYFEIIEDQSRNYLQQSDSTPTVVEIRFQKIKFEQRDSVLVKISNIDRIVQGEQNQARANYQQALTATVSHE